MLLKRRGWHTGFACKKFSANKKTDRPPVKIWAMLVEAETFFCLALCTLGASNDQNLGSRPHAIEHVDLPVATTHGNQSASFFSEVDVTRPVCLQLWRFLSCWVDDRIWSGRFQVWRYCSWAKFVYGFLGCEAWLYPFVGDDLLCGKLGTNYWRCWDRLDNERTSCWSCFGGYHQHGDRKRLHAEGTILSNSCVPDQVEPKHGCEFSIEKSIVNKSKIIHVKKKRKSVKKGKRTRNKISSPLTLLFQLWWPLRYSTCKPCCWWSRCTK